MTILLYTFNMRNSLKTQVESDIWAWITGWVEADHKFYNYRFPPCPYARAARLSGLVDVHAYDGSSAGQWAQEQIDDLAEHKQYNVRVLAFPYWQRWNYALRRRIDSLNCSLVDSDYYAQYGAAVATSSCYPGLFKHRPYFVIIINKVSDVIAAQAALARTDYYDNWTDQHYHRVVTRRNRIFKGSKWTGLKTSLTALH